MEAKTNSGEQSLLAERDGAWLTLWFNQPERRNPLSEAMTAALKQALEEAAADESVRGLTLRGKGGFFCAGGDLAAFQRMASSDRDAIIDMSENAAVLFQMIDEFPKVTIALVEGAAMAGGLGMMCCCDVTVGTATAKFGFSETRIGITPAQIARYVVARTGGSVARRLLLTGMRFNGVQAREFGLLDAVGDDTAACESVEMAVRKDVLACAPGAVAATKTLLRSLSRTEPAAIPRLAAENFADAFLSSEGREGINSFLEQRKPSWVGEN